MKKNQRVVEKNTNDKNTDKKVSDTMTMKDCNDDGQPQQQQPTEPAVESGVSNEEFGGGEKNASNGSEKDTVNISNETGGIEEQSEGDDKLNDTAEGDEARNDGEHASLDDSKQKLSQDLDVQSDEDEDNADEANEEWDLKKIMSVEELTKAPIKCKNEDCTLSSACVYVSNKGETWNTCLDCQVSLFLLHALRVHFENYHYSVLRPVLTLFYAKTCFSTTRIITGRGLRRLARRSLRNPSQIHDR